MEPQSMKRPFKKSFRKSFGYRFGNALGNRLRDRFGDKPGNRLGDESRNRIGDRLGNRLGDKLRKAFRKIFFLSPVPTLLISIPAYALVVYALNEEDVNPIVSYGAYFLSAYALIITITGITRAVGLARRGMDGHPLVRKALGIPLISRYLREDVFRAETALYHGLFINLLYAGIKMFSGICYKSVWFVTLGVYYILLAAMRAALLHYVRRGEKDKRTEWRRYRLCGCILLSMNAALAGIVVLVVHQNSGFEYPGMMIYVMAMYAFYATITAVRNIVKFRKYGSPVLSAAKAVSLTAALVSMLSLETAMLTQFGAAEDPLYRKTVTAATGAGVCILVLGMAVFMIVHSTKRLKEGWQPPPYPKLL